jgi:hypothetical protein
MTHPTEITDPNRPLTRGGRSDFHSALEVLKVKDFAQREEFIADLPRYEKPVAAGKVNQLGYSALPPEQEITSPAGAGRPEFRNSVHQGQGGFRVRPAPRSSHSDSLLHHIRLAILQREHSTRPTQD